MNIYKLIDKLDSVESSVKVVTTEIDYGIGNFQVSFGTIEVNGNKIQSLEGQFNDKGYIFEWWGYSGLDKVYGVDIESILNNLNPKYD